MTARGSVLETRDGQPRPNIGGLHRSDTQANLIPGLKRYFAHASGRSKPAEPGHNEHEVLWTEPKPKSTREARLGLRGGHIEIHGSAAGCSSWLPSGFAYLSVVLILLPIAAGRFPRYRSASAESKSLTLLSASKRVATGSWVSRRGGMEAGIKWTVCDRISRPASWHGRSFLDVQVPRMERDRFLDVQVPVFPVVDADELFILVGDSHRFQVAVE